MFRTFTWLVDWIILRNTCVCSQQQLVGSPSVDLLCNTCVYVLTGAIGLPKSFNLFVLHPDMCVLRKHTHVCAPQQQLVGQPLTLGCNRQLTSSAIHTCVCPQQQIGLPKCWMFRTSLGFFIGLTCNTHVCVHSSNWSTKQQSVCQRVSIGWFCAKHVCIFRNTYVYAHNSIWSANPWVPP